MRRNVLLFLLYGGLAAALLVVLGTRVTGLPPLGVLLDPADGLYRTARTADAAPPSEIDVPGLQAPVRVIWDDRRVPHLFARSDLDGVAALGYVVARERLFQMDFIPRAASGRLAAALGAAALPADRFLRGTGMERAAQRNLERIRAADGMELSIMEAFCRGVNAYMETLGPADLPFEFRLLGYRPDPCTPIQALRVLQYMNYDLIYGTDDPGYGVLRRRLGDEAYHLLYPHDPAYAVPIVGGSGDIFDRTATTGATAESVFVANRKGLSEISPLLEGFVLGKGSNNWAVFGSRSATGRPILAGDMHLSVTLPAIWFEVHLVTPSMNVYGVTVPGAPLPVEAFNDDLGWTFTNTGSDQIDHYRLDVDVTDLTYRFEGTLRDLDVVVDTIDVLRGSSVVDTSYVSHWGPVTNDGASWVAIQWTAHDTSRTLAALWEMNQASDHASFQRALRKWDTPMQNILYADRGGIASIRSTGHLPVRARGDGIGLLDGASREGRWTGRVPFDELPYAVNPATGFLASTNQKPTDASYPHYLGHDWGRPYRSIRIDSLLRSRTSHGIVEMRAYQSDVHAVQHDFFAPLLDTLRGVSGAGGALRDRLVAWDGEMVVERLEPIELHFFLDVLEELTWDEPEFDAAHVTAAGDSPRRSMNVPKPDESRIYHLLTEAKRSSWLDVVSTPEREDAAGLLRAALDSAAARLDRRYGTAEERRVWGRRHKIRFNHLVEALEPLGRGPFSYPGYDETLSPASDTLATHSASWRVVVDFSGDRPRGLGVYPGGQSGNPFSRYYDAHLSTYLDFEYYELLNPVDPSELADERVLHQAVLRSPR
ncbi:MAG: penicillin acylase family protein [Rhodothermales bacterium]